MKLPVILKSILVGIPIGVTFFDSAGYIARVEGVSMQPALNPKETDSEDYVLLNRWSVRTYELTRGDIISLVSPKDPQQKIIKRVVGLEGDIISTLGYKRPYIRIPEGHCWVEGDHTGHSMDSNLFGPVSMGLITARASCIVWPPHRWQSLKPELPTGYLIQCDLIMRAISLVKRLEFDFVGNVFQNALALGDVDNDGHNELIVGNMNGELSIFKYDRLWQKLDGLGMITAIAVGDILNCGSNALVVISGDGWCHILTKRNVIGNSKLQRAGRMESFHVQRIPSNTKVVLLADIDGDGQAELVLGLTDRIVRSYRWLPGGENSSPRLFTLSKWEGANQIGAVTLNHSADGSASVLVSQPGGAYIKISCDDTYNDLNSSISTEGEGLADSTVEYHPLSLSRMRSPNVSTEILGGIRPPIGSASTSQRYAVATLDGTIMLVDNQEILWSMQVEQQVFGIRALDITGDGSDEIVACAWSGQTYFLDQQRRCVRFQVDQPVAGFTAGPYAATAAAGNCPTLVYTTFSNKICVYPDVRVPTMVSRGVQPLPGDLSPAQQRELAEWCLYGKR